MAKQLATSIIPGDKIVVSLGASARGNIAARQTFAATFNHLGEEIDAQGQIVYGKPRLNLNFEKAATAQPTFDINAFNAAVQAGGGRPTPASMRIQADYEAALAKWEDENGNSADASVGDAIARAVLAYITEFYGIATSPSGDRPYVDPSQVVVRPAYRTTDTPVVFSVTLAPVWG